ncbi:restriction endonuclease subunit S [Chromobacterium subtsugae]|uniref:restriction endonuclease subunit S n=1 Tax=Chromobacterium subtsugae TaxID=251747 RepID=UPI000A564BCA|nr:restriction endonuclease subunit S [Chromobacterium subtsugae]
MSSKSKTTATTDEAKRVRVPKLRFPEFRGGEEWEYAPLGKLLMKSPDYGVNAAAVPFTERLPQYLRITDISEDGTYLSAKKVSVDLEPKDEIYLDEGDIVLARTGASVGKSYRYRKADGRLVFAGFLIRVKPNPTRLVSAYLASFLTTEQYWKWVAATSARSGQPGINSVEYSALAIPLPTEFPEQQKIADCLSSVDELISAQARKVDALKTHKKGLMQQLFPREGETQPRLRFPEFQNAGEWRMTTIGDLKPFVTSGSRGWAPFYAEQGELFVRITNLWRDSIYLDLGDSKFVQLPPGSNEGVRTQLKEHDVLISITADIGIIGYVDESVPSPAYINQHIALVRFDAEQLCGKYVAYFLASDKSQSLFRASTDTGTKAGMSLIGIQKIELMLPGLPEQQRIASCLSRLDTLIAAETQKLEALKTHKKGLMQQLFPSQEEV